MSISPQPTPSPDLSQSESESDDLQENALKTCTGPIHKASTENPNKRPRDADDAESSLPNDKAFSNFGRTYSRQDDPFTTIDTIVDFGIKRHRADAADKEIEEDISTLSPRDRRLLHSWELLCSLIPDFYKQMLALSNNYNHPSRKAACQHIFHGVTTVRSDDTASLKIWILSYVRIDPTDSISPAIAINSRLKNDRGFYHPVTASLLCPMMYPDTPETYADIRTGKLPLTATLLPRFLFPEGHVYHPDDISKDLLRGHVMYRAAKHIFQGPSVALEAPGSHRGRQGNAAICGITSMSPRTIAYVATQVRFALSSASSWTAKEGNFSYTDFYWHIVELFDDEDDLEGPEIIKFYNHHVFGTEDPQHATDTSTEVPNEYELIRQQRAAKRACISLDY